jgi:hypothetical protein
MNNKRKMKKKKKKKHFPEPGMATQVYNPSNTGNSNLGEASLRAAWAKSSQDPISTNDWAQWPMPVILAMQGSTSRKNEIQVGLGLKQDAISKITKAKSWGVAQVVEHLPSKCKALSSSPSTEKKKKKSTFHQACG